MLFEKSRFQKSRCRRDSAHEAGDDEVSANAIHKFYITLPLHCQTVNVQRRAKLFLPV